MDGDLNLIKGGGGALFREKILAFQRSSLLSLIIKTGSSPGKISVAC